MSSKRMERFKFTLNNLDKIRIEEVFRLGALRDGIQLTTQAMRFPILGQVIPRIEIEISGPDFLKKVTVRINQHSPFLFDGSCLRARINGTDMEVACKQFVDDERAPTGMYNFGMMRENGVRSFVFDYHTYCTYSCDFCFKENEWEVLAIEGGGSNNYKANFAECLEYVSSHQQEFRDDYDIVWLCTGSIPNEKLELERHATLARRLREVGYSRGIYVSQVIPVRIRKDEAARREYLAELHEAGISRFNSGVEIVNPEYRKKYIHGYKGTLVFDDYVNAFRDGIDVFGQYGVGSCLLAGIEPPEDTLHGLKVISDLGVVPAPTVLTPFVEKQKEIPFMYDLDTLIDVHVGFNELIEQYDLPVFSGVFSLA